MQKSLAEEVSRSVYYCYILGRKVKFLPQKGLIETKMHMFDLPSSHFGYIEICIWQEGGTALSMIIVIQLISLDLYHSFPGTELVAMGKTKLVISASEEVPFSHKWKKIHANCSHSTEDRHLAQGGFYRGFLWAMVPEPGLKWWARAGEERWGGRVRASAQVQSHITGESMCECRKWEQFCH